MYKRDPFGLGILCAIALVSILTISQLFSSAFTELNMRRFHFQVPYAVYCLLQPVPSMYNYENTYIYKKRDDEQRGYINHHSTRLFYEPKSRNRILTDSAVQVTLSSAFNDYTFSSTWMLTKDAELTSGK